MATLTKLYLNGNAYDLAYNSTITIQKNGTTVDTFTLNQSSGKTVNIPVPTKTSDITNDSGFITNSVNDLTNYYKKSETYTRAEIENLVANFAGFEVVTDLPTTDIKTNIIYLKGPIGTGADKYEEWIYSNSTWIKIGETSVDLTNYVTTNTAQSITAKKTFNVEPELGTAKTTDATNDGTKLATEAQVYKKQDTLTLPATPTSGHLVTWGANNKTLVDGGAVPSVGNGEVTIKQGGTTKGSFTMNQSGSGEVNLNTSKVVTAAEYADITGASTDGNLYFIHD